MLLVTLNGLSNQCQLIFKVQFYILLQFIRSFMLLYIYFINRAFKLAHFYDNNKTVLSNTVIFKQKNSATKNEKLFF